MRYLINMDYSFDMNINTLGRRIRTRLYFTSESHLHTVLNVLRFAKSGDGSSSLLSEQGLAIVNGTPELCYLTQLVMRVFEDSRRDINDPRRFRVELLFSPGATATPFHLDESNRRTDSSRFDTAPLQKIGRDDLTCEDVEEFFESAIMEGRSDEETLGSYEVASTNQDAGPKLLTKDTTSIGTQSAHEIVEKPPSPEKQAVPPAPSSPSRASSVSTMPSVDHVKVTEDSSKMTSSSVPRQVTAKAESIVPITETLPWTPQRGTNSSLTGTSGESDNGDGTNGTVAEEPDENVEKKFSRKYFWSAVAVGSFCVGVGCLLMAVSLAEKPRHSRRWTSRY